MNTKPAMPFKAWKHKFDAHLTSLYAIGISDTGLSDKELQNAYYQGNEHDPLAAAKEYGDKYDLVPKTTW